MRLDESSQVSPAAYFVFEILLYSCFRVSRKIFVSNKIEERTEFCPVLQQQMEDLLQRFRFTFEFGYFIIQKAFGFDRVVQGIVCVVGSELVVLEQGVRRLSGEE